MVIRVMQGGGKSGQNVQDDNDDENQDNNKTPEMTKLEVELCKQNFQFYDK